jgi:hypothetical protein
VLSLGVHAFPLTFMPLLLTNTPIKAKRSD